MSDFYGKRFLSSLLGALSVLSSPVASARDDKLGKGNLKGKVGSSAGRGENGGELGELKSNRKVKGVKNLKKVLKETDGEVVGVSPDGKGGFVVFIKTPTGKVVALTIVGVPLVVVISCLVYFGRKNGEIIKASDIGEFGESIEESIASVNLLDDLFDSSKDKYGLFVSRLFKFFFDDEKIIRQKFSDFEGNLDKFLESVFAVSSFDGNGGGWHVKYGEYDGCAWLGFGTVLEFAIPFGGASKFGSLVAGLFGYLQLRGLVNIPEDQAEASWGDRIGVVLFAIWCSVEFELVVEDLFELKRVLERKDTGKLKRVFRAISGYVRDRLEAAGKGYDGQELKPVG